MKRLISLALIIMLACPSYAALADYYYAKADEGAVGIYTFENFTPFTASYGSNNTKEGLIMRHTNAGSGKDRLPIPNDVVESDGNKYFSFWLDGANKGDAAYPRTEPKLYTELEITDPSDDIYHISFDIMTGDTVADKKVRLNEKHNDGFSKGISLLHLKTNGSMIFSAGTDAEYSMTYSTGTWYKIDILWNFATGRRDYFVDGTRVGGGEVAPWSSFTQKANVKSLTFIIGASEASLTQEQVTGLCIDNLFARLYPISTSINPITIDGIGSDGVVDFGQNVVKVKLSDIPPFLTKDNFKLVSALSGAEKTISDMEITSDGIVLELDSDLPPWTDYILKLSFGDEVKDFTEGTLPEAVSTMEAYFHTPTAPVDIKDPVFTVSGNTITSETTVINTSGNTEVMSFVYVSYGENGVVKSVKSTTDENFNYGYPGKEVSASTDFEPGDKIKLFITKGWNNPVPLFEKSWYISDSGELMVPSDAESASDVAEGTMVLGDFDYENLKITAGINCGTEALTDGILYIRNKNAALGDDFVVYADYISTSRDGTFKKDIYFKDGFNSKTGTYVVEFYSNHTSDVISSEFTCMSDEDILKSKKDELYKLAKASTTFSALMQAITGTNSKEEVVNDNFELFCDDADVSTYNKVKSKASVFIIMLEDLSKADDFDSLVELFEEAAKAQLKKEQKPTSSSGGGGSSSSGNKSYGATSQTMAVVPPKAEESQNTTGGTLSVFRDLDGHWAQKHANALVEKGIVNGYEDGTFRADSYITRAEITKIIVEALDIPALAGKEYTDVASSSWYAPFVARASSTGVVTGFEDGSFAPDKYVSRQDAVLMIYRAMSYHATLPTGYKFFADENQIADYASDATRCLGDIGVINGTEDNSFLPLNNITRGEMAAVICRAMDYMESHLK